MLWIGSSTFGPDDMDYAEITAVTCLPSPVTWQANDCSVYTCIHLHYTFLSSTEDDDLNQFQCTTQHIYDAIIHVNTASKESKTNAPLDEKHIWKVYLFRKWSLSAAANHWSSKDVYDLYSGFGDRVCVNLCAGLQVPLCFPLLFDTITSNNRINW